MDDVTKRLIDAACCVVGAARIKHPDYADAWGDFEAAVDAYRKANRPPMERLADLKPGAVVLTKDNATRTLLLNHPKSQKYAYERHGDLCLSEYSWVSVIVSEGPDQ